MATAIPEDKIKFAKAIASPKIAFCSATPFAKRGSGVVVDRPSKGRLTPLSWSTSLVVRKKSKTFAPPTSGTD
jgi:hypothetical protein